MRCLETTLSHRKIWGFGSCLQHDLICMFQFHLSPRSERKDRIWRRGWLRNREALNRTLCCARCESAHTSVFIQLHQEITAAQNRDLMHRYLRREAHHIIALDDCCKLRTEVRPRFRGPEVAGTRFSFGCTRRSRREAGNRRG